MDPSLLTLVLSSTSRSAPVFVDVGANHPTRGSQTRELEELGWRGLCVEPNRRLHAMYARANRTCELDGRVVYGDVASRQPFARTENAETNGLALHGADNAFATGRMTPTVPLMDVVAAYFLPAPASHPIDFMSVDTEGSEEGVLTQRTLAALDVRTLLIERPSLRLVQRLFASGFLFAAHDTRGFASLFTRQRGVARNSTFSLLPAKCTAPSSGRALGRSRLPGRCPSVFGCCKFDERDDANLYHKFE